ncbi:MAG: hypothetical protein JXB42_06730 [Deltaproteobacteria bacterium]|nr:hypothetical protein [Deltaproteobacteria bacterium]
MKKNNVNIVMVLVFVITLSMSINGLKAADNAKEGEAVKITGTINEIDQLIAEDGVIYEIDITDAGNALVEEAGKKVEATGFLEDLAGVKSISISSYRIIEK